MTVSRCTPVSRPVLRTPTPSARWPITATAVSREVRPEQGRPLALRRARLAGAASQHPPRLAGTVAVAHREISRPPLAVLGAVGIQAAEPREVVHGEGSQRHPSGGRPVTSCLLSYSGGRPTATKSG